MNHPDTNATNIDPSASPEQGARPSSQTANPFGLIGIDAIFAPLAAPVSTVGGLIRKGSVTVLAGPSGSGKTWVLLSLVLATVFGEPWLGVLPTFAGLAVILDYEVGQYELRRRLQLMRGAYGEAPPPLGNLSLSSMPSLYVTTPGFFEAIRALARTTSLIVIDSLLAAFRGVDENHSSIRWYLDELRRIAEETGCSIILVHHTGKGSSDMRGSSAIRDAVDEVLLLEPLGDGRTRISTTKGRHDLAGQGIVFRSIRLPDGQVLLYAVSDFASVAAGGSTKADPQRHDDQQVLDFVGRNPRCGKRSVRDGAGLSHDAADAALQRLLATERIRNVGTSSRHEYIVIDPDLDEGTGGNSPPVASLGNPSGVPGVPVPLRARHAATERAARAGTAARTRTTGGESPSSLGDGPPWRTS